MFAPMAKRVAGVLFVLLSVLLVGCDHATKAVATRSLLRAVPIQPGLELRFVPNDDVAFNLFQRLGVPHSPLLLAGVMLLALVVPATLFLRSRVAVSRLDLAGGACIVAGALGNLVDRVARGFVVDFIHVGGWPVFNVADAAVVVGVGLLALARMQRQRARA